MRHYGIEYNLNGRNCYEIFAVCSGNVLAAEIDNIKAKGGENIRVHCID